MSVILELSIFPLDKGMSLSPYVARAVKIIKASGLDYTFGPMGTCIEGNWNEVMDVAKACFDELSADSDRVIVNMKADWRRGRKDGLKSKVQSVRDKADF